MIISAETAWLLVRIGAAWLAVALIVGFVVGRAADIGDEEDGWPLT